MEKPLCKVCNTRHLLAEPHELPRSVPLRGKRPKQARKRKAK